ncbi:hypothetical protein QQF64_024140 [Cirrhinus molitorella]|uniref:Uncharacterized protein n=1 Tax=Cirrhinus molitorella TaxID=172907 RepID=A0ABR3NL25_9TELE
MRFDSGFLENKRFQKVKNQLKTPRSHSLGEDCAPPTELLIWVFSRRLKWEREHTLVSPQLTSLCGTVMYGNHLSLA